MQDDLNNPKSIKTNLNNLLISTGSPAFVEKKSRYEKTLECLVKPCNLATLQSCKSMFP